MNPTDEELLKLLQQPVKPIMITIELSNLIGCLKEAFQCGVEREKENKGVMKDA